VLRYIDRYVTVNQGSVFYITEALAQLEGLERGPAGNTSLTAAFSLARDLGEEEVIVVNETEYTSAGKHPYEQITFARKMGIEIFRGEPSMERPGENIVIPMGPEQVTAGEVDLDGLRKSYIKNACKGLGEDWSITRVDLDFICDDTRLTEEKGLELLAAKGVNLSA
jgi:hypothetical protein